MDYDEDKFVDEISNADYYDYNTFKYNLDIDKVSEVLNQNAEKAKLLDMLTESLEGVDHLLLTTGHPEFGIECSITIGDDYATVINQPDEITAIIAARRELDYQKIVDDGLKKIGEYNSQFFRKDDEGDE